MLFNLIQKTFVLLLLFPVFRAQTQNPITEGTLRFQIIDNTDLDSLYKELDALAAELAGAGLYEDTASAKASADRVKKDMASMLESQSREIQEYTFTQNKAVLLLYENGVRKDNHYLYDLDSMKAHSRLLLNGKVRHSVDDYGPRQTSSAWKDEQTFVLRVDSADVKEIAGFRCIKYYVRHSHRMARSSSFSRENELVQYDFELYVTDAIRFPLYILLPMFRTAPFEGCPLEYREINDKFFHAKRAVSFSPTVDHKKFEVPEYLKK